MFVVILSLFPKFCPGDKKYSAAVTKITIALVENIPFFRDNVC